MPVLEHDEDFFANPKQLFEDWLNTIDHQAYDIPPAIEVADNSVARASIQPSEIAFEGTLRINGYVAGVISSTNGCLVVDDAGEVDADIFVNVATIHGCVRGDIRATEKVELSSAAKVIGDIETTALSIEPGAVFEGRCLFLQSSETAETNECCLAATI